MSAGVAEALRRTVGVVSENLQADAAEEASARIDRVATGSRWPPSPEPGTYLVVVEAPGYEVETKEVGVTEGQTSRVAIELKPTWKPLLLQRIFRSK
jgi:hypothetical protein